MNNKTSSYINIINILFFFILSLISIGFIIIHKPSLIYNLVVIGICYMGLIYFEHKYKTFLKPYIKIHISVVIILHLAGGQLFNLYMTSYWFDNLLHLLGSFSFSLFYYSILCSLINFNTKSKTLIFIIVASLGITGGVFFEILEFILDDLFNGNNQNGITDTNLDLIFDIIGSILAGLFISSKSKQKRNSQ